MTLQGDQEKMPVKEKLITSQTGMGLLIEYSVSEAL